MSHSLCKYSVDSQALDFTLAQSMASSAAGPDAQSAPSSAATACQLMARFTGDCSRRWVWRNQDYPSLLVGSAAKNAACFFFEAAGQLKRIAHRGRHGDQDGQTPIRNRKSPSSPRDESVRLADRIGIIIFGLEARERPEVRGDLHR